MATYDPIPATELLKRNIFGLLDARAQTAASLALHCGKSESWLSALKDDPKRGIPPKHYDRIAEFFGLDVAQLFQYGTVEKGERRSGIDRRSGLDRRLIPPGRAEAVSILDTALVGDVLALPTAQKDHLRVWIAALRHRHVVQARTSQPDTEPPAGAPALAPLRRSQSARPRKTTTKRPKTPR